MGTAEILDDLHSHVEGHLRKGFMSVHEIIEDATEYALGKHNRDGLLPDIKRIVFDSIAAKKSEQSAWEGDTDCDRLDEAFNVLNQLGIVARQNFTCCNTCGFKEIWDEVEEEETRRTVEGYVFYHLQATDMAINTGTLMMAYGCVEEDEDQLVKVANRIVEELQSVGLYASWNGTPFHPIIVEDIVWRKRS